MTAGASEPSYGAPGYGASVGSTGLSGAEPPRYGVPTPASSLDAPTGHAYAAPATGGYPAQAAPGYGQAEASRYPAQAATGYPAREAPRYRAPETPAYPAPGAPPYHTPEAPARPAPENTGYATPETPRYAAPEAGAWPSPAPSGAPTVGGQRESDRAGSAADGYSGQGIQNQIRQAVVHRVQYANALHASHYWDLRRTKPVGPHALIFMYGSLDSRFSDPRRPYYEIKAASRLFRDGADVQDLPALLHELTEIAKSYLADGRVFDPVAQMTQSADPMPADATYVGVAVSTLLGSVEEIGDEPLVAIGGMGIPGRCLVALSDNNLLVVERPPRAHEQVEVYSTFPYTTGGGVEYRSWRPFSQEQLADPAWRWLQHLNQLVLTGQERKAAAAAAAVAGGRRRR
ncbi:hypothetical protein ONA70_30850 [Micromonospora yasonensis]|uniref:hypothetical protein n=1 Tax=Micromonospora yasonensis TaxID=1128667 RepID=UPI00222EC8B3|nr:hypothetical protein [Micromonospora yasonensis]MCW3844494.1 hypothetical protein [Micromonospora yasonensis]